MDVASLNPGIRDAVLALREAGFDTQNSGDGQTHDCECDRDYPFVVIRVDPADLVATADRLALFLSEKGISVDEDGPDGLPEDSVNIEAFYNPAYVDNDGYLDVTSLTLAPWKKLTP